MEDIKLGIYRHYKNKLYRVQGIAIHSETLEKMVIYEAQYENELGKVWVRPLNDFIVKAPKNELNQEFRFEFLHE